jgi:signal transduction histidine kinase
MTLSGDAAAVYLHQLQPHDLADLMKRTRHELSMLVGSYASYFELLQTQLKDVSLSEDIADHYGIGLEEGIVKLRGMLDKYPDFGELQADADLATNWLHVIIHDLRSPIGILLGWNELLQYEFSQMSPSPLRDHLQHLNQSMQTTAERMFLITKACYEFRRSATQ